MLERGVLPLRKDGVFRLCGGDQEPFKEGVAHIVRLELLNFTKISLPLWGRANAASCYDGEGRNDGYLPTAGNVVANQTKTPTFPSMRAS